MRLFTLTAALFAATSVLAAQPYRYQCFPKDEAGGTAEKMNVTITGTSATLEGHRVKLDPTYKPRKNLDYVRFDGDTDWLNADGYQIDLLFHKTMLKGAARASLKVMARGEGFYNDFYSCFRRN